MLAAQEGYNYGYSDGYDDYAYYNDYDDYSYDDYDDYSYDDSSNVESTTDG